MGHLGFCFPVLGWEGLMLSFFRYPTRTEAVPPGKRVENKIRVPVRYCMLGSRDSARSDTPCARRHQPLSPRPPPCALAPREWGQPEQE